MAKILIVDDMPFNNEYVEEQLQILEHDVVTAVDGDDALESILIKAVGRETTATLRGLVTDEDAVQDIDASSISAQERAGTVLGDVVLDHAVLDGEVILSCCLITGGSNQIQT